LILLKPANGVKCLVDATPEYDRGGDLNVAPRDFSRMRAQRRVTKWFGGSRAASLLQNGQYHGFGVDSETACSGRFAHRWKQLMKSR
jgi:hypothetical protein